MDGPTQRLTALLGGLTNWERLRSPNAQWTLANLQAQLAHPQFVLPGKHRVQVGGSKGKGTTCMWLEALARGAGLTTGTYLSPHLQTILERVRLQGENVSEAALAAALTTVLDRAKANGAELSFFEAITAAALLVFERQPLDLVILEVGLGGRLDATTAVPVDASILTMVELEHTAVLGDSIAAIAAEKAWIARPQAPLFTAVQGIALEVVADHCRRVGSGLWRLGSEFGLDQVVDRGDRLTGVLWTPARRQPFCLPNASATELPAFALAAACLQHLAPDLGLPLDPAPRPLLPGRFEIRGHAAGPVVLDGAHTEASLRALAAELKRRFPGQRPTVLFACAQGKRWQAGLNALVPCVDRWIVTALTELPAEPPSQIVQHLTSLGASAGEVPAIDAAIAELLRIPGLRVVTGSFYLVGAARSHLEASRPIA